MESFYTFWIRLQYKDYVGCYTLFSYLSSNVIQKFLSINIPPELVQITTLNCWRHSRKAAIPASNLVSQMSLKPLDPYRGRSLFSANTYTTSFITFFGIIKTVKKNISVKTNIILCVYRHHSLGIPTSFFGYFFHL